MWNFEANMAYLDVAHNQLPPSCLYTWVYFSHAFVHLCFTSELINGFSLHEQKPVISHNQHRSKLLSLVGVVSSNRRTVVQDHIVTVSVLWGSFKVILRISSSADETSCPLFTTESAQFEESGLKFFTLVCWKCIIKNKITWVIRCLLLEILFLCVGRFSKMQSFSVGQEDLGMMVADQFAPRHNMQTRVMWFLPPEEYVLLCICVCMCFAGWEVICYFLVHK